MFFEQKSLSHFQTHLCLKQAETMMNTGNLFAKFETNSLDSYDQNSSDSDEEDDFNQSSLNANTSAEKKEIKRRQRLTHLTVEEKIMRRKLKVT